MFASVEFTVESLSAHRAVDKLARAGILVLSAKSLGKNAIDIRIAGKDCKKGFAILRSSCYNIKNIRYRGGLRLARACKRTAGLIVGGIVCLGAVVFFESRVLRVEISGSGAYYEREIRAILAEEGVKQFSAFPSDSGAITAKILGLDRVEFCSFRLKGGVLTVDVEVSEEIKRPESLPLYAPASGTVEELVVVRGTPLVQEGDEVTAGDVVVANYATFGENRHEVVVIARVTVRYDVEREYELGEEEALAQALLDYGELENIHIQRTDRGWLVGGTAFSTAAVGLD